MARLPQYTKHEIIDKLMKILDKNENYNLVVFLDDDSDELDCIHLYPALPLTID